MIFFSFSLLAVIAAIVWKSATTMETFTPEKDSLIGRNILITGATTGLGLESAKRLAVGGANLILTARSDAKGQAAVEAVSTYLQDRNVSYENQKISYKLLDLDNLASVKEAANWDDVTQIDVLLNNAGVMALPEREITVDGFEKQMQSNHLGHFVLTSILKEKFTRDCRIINVSSSAHKFATTGLDFDYMWKADESYGALKSYGQSKLANIYFTQAFQRRIEEAGLPWTVTAVHPGVVATDLFRYLVKNETLRTILDTLFRVTAKTGLVRQVEQGATTQIWLAAATDDDLGGKFYSDCQAETLGSAAMNETAAERLWQESEELAGVKFTL